jgi:hypothetical protein
MLGSLYADLIEHVDVWTTYPGHGGNPNKVMGSFLDIAAKLFRDKYREDLLVRHQPALRSRAAWGGGDRWRALGNQLDSMRLGAPYEGALTDQSVLVVDNFLTRGYSTETARNLLLAGGAREVYVACVGRYPPSLNVLTAPRVPWDPFRGPPPPERQWDQDVVAGVTDHNARAGFLRSYTQLAGERW